jgi:hypothetical protein
LEKLEVAVAFPSCSIAEANQLAIELQARFSRISASRGLRSSIEATIFKSDPNHQDFGASLAIIFGTPAAVAIAKGVHDLIAAKGHEVVIKTKGGSIIARGNAAKNIDISETVIALGYLSKV